MREFSLEERVEVITPIVDKFSPHLKMRENPEIGVVAQEIARRLKPNESIEQALTTVYQIYVEQVEYGIPPGVAGMMNDLIIKRAMRTYLGSENEAEKYLFDRAQQFRGEVITRKGWAGDKEQYRPMVQEIYDELQVREANSP